MTLPPIVPGPGPATPPIPIVPPPAKRGLSQGWIAAIVIFALLAAAALWFGLGLSWPPKFGSNASGDVTIERCGTTAGGNPSADLRVANTTSSDKTYVITVEFVSGSTRYGRDTAIVAGLHPGQVTRKTSTANADVSGTFDCQVTSVNRT